jgi:hypothetical protein
MLAVRSAVLLLTASPLGTALGGPLTTALGPRAALGGSGLATVVLGVVACVLLLGRRRNRRPTDQESRSIVLRAAARVNGEETDRVREPTISGGGP